MMMSQIAALVAEIERLNAENAELEFLLHEGGTWEQQLSASESRVAELTAEVERLKGALSEIVEFCDNPHGSEKPESLAMGLARLLPAARSVLEG
jgi:uncharacterized small protein (DUF1192 family)